MNHACSQVFGGDVIDAVPATSQSRTIHLSVKSPSRADSEQLGLRFNADAVVDGSTDSLLAAEGTFGRLHRNCPRRN